LMESGRLEKKRNSRGIGMIQRWGGCSSQYLNLCSSMCSLKNQNIFFSLKGTLMYATTNLVFKIYNSFFTRRMGV
jgi:hypothetical protein